MSSARLIPGLRVVIAAALLSAMAACSHHSSDTSPALQQIVAGTRPANTPPPVWKDVQAFYASRAYAPAWIDGKPGARAAAALATIQSASAHGLSPADYGAPGLAQTVEALRADTKKIDEQRVADLDARLTTALLALGRDVAIGRTAPHPAESHWKARRQVPDLAGTLNQSANGDVTMWLDAVRPRHPEYAALQKSLAGLQAQDDQGEWPAVPKTMIKPGSSGPAVAAMRRRLAASGELSATSSGADTETAYDENVQSAVRAFQEHNGLKATGAIDAATIAAMNIPLAERIRQVALNLERWRWMPDDLGDRHFIVNIPYFHLFAREHGKPVKDIRVIVGQPGKETPIFSSDMTTVVFSPYWNIPDSIAEGETAPKAARDPEFLSRNNIEILRVSKSGTTTVDPSKVDWDDASALKELSFRQRPGDKNALGHVKFLFPNPFDVYLHDTPSDNLFGRTGRAFSHGCVRVEEPEELAKYVLRGYPEWDETHILAAMNAGVEKQVKLTEPIPVHIVYFTAWVDDAGGLHFQPDIYGYDKR